MPAGPFCQSVRRAAAAGFPRLLLIGGNDWPVETSYTFQHGNTVCSFMHAAETKDARHDIEAD
jgi:hypothetical protein